MHAFGACCGSLDALEMGACARSISMKVSQSTRQLAKVVPRCADGKSTRPPKRIGRMQYYRGLECVGHLGGRNSEDASHPSKREVASA